MRILFDQGTPVPLRQHFENHQVSTAFEKGWFHLENGDLLTAAEQEFDLPKLRARAAEVAKVVHNMQAGEYREFV